MFTLWQFHEKLNKNNKIEDWQGRQKDSSAISMPFGLCAIML